VDDDALGTSGDYWIRQPGAGPDGGRNAKWCSQDLCIRGGVRTARRRATDFTGQWIDGTNVLQRPATAGRDPATPGGRSKLRERGALGWQRRGAPGVLVHQQRECGGTDDALRSERDIWSDDAATDLHV